MDPAFQPDNLALKLSTSRTNRVQDFPFGDPNKPVYRKVGQDNYEQYKSPRTPRTSRVRDEEQTSKFQIDKKMLIAAAIGALIAIIVASIIIGILLATGVIPTGTSSPKQNGFQLNETSNQSDYLSQQQPQNHPNTQYMLPPTQINTKHKTIHRLRS